MWRTPGEPGGERFPIVRKGYDRSRVDAALAELHSVLSSVEERARQLEAQLTATRSRLEELESDTKFALSDPERASKLIGAGASELLRSASDAALAIRTQAEQTAAELLERARHEAAELVVQARQKIDSELAEAEATRTALLEEAERTRASTIEEAKREGRALVQRAKEYADRLRSEADTEVRTHRDEAMVLEKAATELRDLLRRAHGVVGEVLGDLDAPAAPQPGESPRHATTRLAPPSSEADRPVVEQLASSASRQVVPAPTGSDELGALTQLLDQVAAASLDDVSRHGNTQTGRPSEPTQTLSPPPRDDAAALVPSTTASEPAGSPGGEGTAAIEDEPGARVARLEELFRTLQADREDNTEVDDHEPAEEERPAATSTPVADELDRAEDDEAVDPEVRQRIEDLFVPLHLDLTRRVKRVVQDELNALLATLRTGGRDGALSWLSSPDQSTRARALTILVANLVAAGQSLGDPEQQEPGAEEATQAITGALMASLDELTINRVRSAIAATEDEGELANVVNALYREVRARRLDELASDYAATAFCTGVRLAPHVTGFVWMTRSNTSPCADCEDNVLAGVNAPNELFPTGHENPPSHPGCTCLIAPVFA